ncbi:tape measure protein [Enterococcus sp. CSURQ0835]|uniref:tape measure protein n=1 Tax=Enterococcus sp. CSURQ0835 TaxID=2681394 RepID=UPI00135C1562|nr:tape measure protein [Enterococcus sp. CSURQ0835]
MAENVASYSISLGLDASSYTSSMKNLTGSVEKSMSGFKKSFLAVDDVNASLKGLAAQQDNYQKKLQGLNNELPELKRNYQKLKSEVEGNADATAKQRAALSQSESAYKGAQSQIKSYTGEINRAQNQIDQLNSDSTKAGNSFRNMGNQASEAGNDIGRFSSGLSRIGSKLTSSLTKPALAAGAAAGAASNIVGRVVDSVMNLKDEAFEASDSMDKFTQTMQFAEIDNSKIKESQKIMKDYADQTVYELGDVMNTTAQLAANGVEDFNGLTQAIGNVNAVSGGNAETFKSVATAMTQTIGTGKLTTENFNQISDAIPGASGKIQAALKEMGAYTSGDFRAAMEEGEISADEMSQAFMNLGMTDVAKKASSSTKTIEGAVGNLQAGVVNMINELMGALGKGNITTFIDGITNGVDNLTKMIKPGAQAAVDAIKPLQDAFKDLLGMFSNNATEQLKGFDLLRHILPPEVAQTIIENVGRVKKVVLGIWDGFSNNDSSFIYKMGLQPETVAQIEGIINQIKSYMTGFVDNFKGLFSVASEVIKGVISSLAPYIMPIISQISTALGEIGSSMTKFWNENGKQILEAIRNFFTFIQPVISIVMQLVSGFIGNLIGLTKGLLNAIQGAVKIFTGIFTGDFSKMWEGVKQLFFGAVEAIWNFVQIMLFKRMLDGVGGLVNGFKTSIQNLWTSVQTFFRSGVSSIDNLIVGWVTSLLGRISNLRLSFVEMVRGLWGSVKTFFDDGIRASLEGIRNWVVNIGTHITSLRDNMINRIISLWESIKGLFSSSIENIVGKMAALPGRIADGIKAGASVVKNAFSDMFGAVVKVVKKPVNQIIGGANWVLEKFGADKLPEWSYAKGTPTKGHPGGNALVNDGRGAEMVIMPNGNAFIPRGKNVMIPAAPRGMHVLSAEETAEATGRKRPTFRYEKGTGLFGSLAEMAKGAVNAVVDGVEDIFDFFDDPKALVDKVLKSVVNLTGMKGFPLNAGQGLVKKSTDAMVTWVQGLFDEYGGGTFDGSIAANGVYAYLVEVAEKVIRKFGSGLQITSGYRPGDEHHHGKRQAIDIANGGVGTPLYTEAANWAFDKFPKEVGYVITNGIVRDRMGYTRGGTSGKPTPWGSHDHDNHIHISGLMGAGDIYQAGHESHNFGGVSGSVGKNWTAQIKKAAAQMKEKISPRDLNNILALIQMESSGRENVQQGAGVWDVNAATGNWAQGLLQYVPSTFRSYAVRGYGNIHNGYHQLLAFFNDRNWRRAISNWQAQVASGKTGWGPIGPRRFENGGLITRDGLYRAGEGNKPEMVIPLTQRTRAMELMAQVLAYLGGTGSTTTINNAGADMSETNSRLDQLIEIMTGFSDDLKNLKMEMNGREVASVVETENAAKALIQSKIRGEG